MASDNLSQTRIAERLEGEYGQTLLLDWVALCKES